MTDPLVVSDAPVQVVAVIVAGGLAWAGQCFREFRGLEDRVQARIEELKHALASQSGRRLATILRAALTPLLATYFEQTPTEVPVPVTGDDLQFAAMEMAASPDIAPLVFRNRVTRPVVATVAARLAEVVGELGPKIAFTPEVVDAAYDLGAFPLEFDWDEREARYLSFRYLGQCVALVAWAGIVLGAVAQVLDPLLAVVVGAGAVIHGIGLEVSRRRLEGGLRRRATIGELVHS